MSEQGPQNQPQSPQMEHPTRHGQPVWKQKESPKWPMWAVIAILAIAVIYFLAAGLKVPDWAKSKDTGGGTSQPKTPVRTVIRTGEPVNPMALITDGVYSLSADNTPLSPDPGRNIAKDSFGVKTLPRDTQIGVISSREMSGVKWYYVQAVGPDSVEIGRGWVASSWLAGQNLKMMQ